MTLKLLTEHHLEFLSLKGGCTGSSESTLVKLPHCLTFNLSHGSCEGVGPLGSLKFIFSEHDYLAYQIKGDSD